MKDQEQFDQFLELCRTVFDRMRADGIWPWSDSQDFENLIESDDNPLE